MKPPSNPKPVQYILPAARSSAMPPNEVNSLVTKSSTPLPSRLPRWMKPPSHPKPVQYILPLAASKAMSPGEATQTKVSTPLPPRLARWIAPFPACTQYTLPLLVSKAMLDGPQHTGSVTRSSAPLPSRFERLILNGLDWAHDLLPTGAAGRPG